MDLMRGLACIRLRATLVAENSLKRALQDTQVAASSGDVALHLEHVCMLFLQWTFSMVISFPLKGPV
jgi:hypothetical protein